MRCRGPSCAYLGARPACERADVSTNFPFPRYVYVQKITSALSRACPSALAQAASVGARGSSPEISSRAKRPVTTPVLCLRLRPGSCARAWSVRAHPLRVRWKPPTMRAVALVAARPVPSNGRRDRHPRRPIQTLSQTRTRTRTPTQIPRQTQNRMSCCRRNRSPNHRRCDCWVRAWRVVSG